MGLIAGVKLLSAPLSCEYGGTMLTQPKCCGVYDAKLIPALLSVVAPRVTGRNLFKCQENTTHVVCVKAIECP